jgi:hypothetical protein
MTTEELIPFTDNKHYCICYQYAKELTDLKDQVTCLQKSIANLRKDLCSPVTATSRNKDSRFGISKS